MTNASDGPDNAASRRTEITRIREALEATSGNQTRAASLLAMPVRTFFGKAKLYGLTPKKKRYDH